MFDLYRAVRPLLFAIPPEATHAAALAALNISNRLGLITSPVETSAPVNLFGLRFPNQLGVADGLDKNGVAIDALGQLGFGFVEVGTVTPKAQPGNARPRLFRLSNDEALINRMGFPNGGVAALIEKLKRRTYRGICGVNIGKNATTPLSDAAADYLACLTAVYDYADYVAINVSSPNTADLRSLQGRDALSPLLTTLLTARSSLQRERNRSVPILLKLTVDLSDRLGSDRHDGLIDAVKVARESGVDGIVLSNTTTSRAELRYPGEEAGGLSGRPLMSRTCEAIQRIRADVSTTFPIIGVGGIASARDAIAFRRAGADLLQIYTGLIYRGPALIGQVLSSLANE